MTNAATEPRAPGSSAQPSDDDRLVPLDDLLEKAERKGCLDEVIKFINDWQPSVSERGDPPEPETASDGLHRLAKRFPKQVEKILRIGEPDCAGEGQCDI